MSSEITLTNNEIKYIIKIIKYLENREILLKETTRKIICQEGWLLGNFLGLSMIVALPWMENVFAPLAKRFLIPLGLMATASATDTDN